MRIAVLFGGESEERDVSIASASQVVLALRSRGHDVLAVDTAFGALDRAEEGKILVDTVASTPPTEMELAAAKSTEATLQIPAAVADCDLVFLALHGGSGEDGRLQALLELAGVPYTGSGPLASGIAMDKDISKTLLRAQRVPTPDWLMAPTTVAEVDSELGFPVIVKPVGQGSSVGLSVVHNPGELTSAIDKASMYGEVMIERFIPGRELTVGVLADEPLAVGEVILSPEATFSYEEKYQTNAVCEQFPANLPDALAEKARALALRAHRVHRLNGYSRTDFRLDTEGSLWVIEVNSLPGLTATSLLPQSCSAVGIDYTELCERICREALGRWAL